MEEHFQKIYVACFFHTEIWLKWQDKGRIYSCAFLYFNNLGSIFHAIIYVVISGLWQLDFILIIPIISKHMVILFVHCVERNDFKTEWI